MTDDCAGYTPPPLMAPPVMGDPADKTLDARADGAFKGASAPAVHRGGYGSNVLKLARRIAWRGGNGLHAGELKTILRGLLDRALWYRAEARRWRGACHTWREAYGVMLAEKTAQRHRAERAERELQAYRDRELLARHAPRA